jgi:hypothetical protein
LNINPGFQNVPFNKCNLRRYDTEKGFVVTKSHRSLQGKKLNLFMVNPLFDARPPSPEYSGGAAQVESS